MELPLEYSELLLGGLEALQVDMLEVQLQGLLEVCQVWVIQVGMEQLLWVD